VADRRSAKGKTGGKRRKYIKIHAKTASAPKKASTMSVLFSVIFAYGKLYC
jgi:hypothetical protein